jgi:hypothetical protein
MKKPRNPMHVCIAMSQIVPEDIKPQFEKLARDVSYMAPELVGMAFNRIASLVEDVVGAPPITDDWKLEIVAKLMDIPLDLARIRFT